jgi:hypothetical protein
VHVERGDRDDRDGGRARDRVHEHGRRNRDVCCAADDDHVRERNGGGNGVRAVDDEVHVWKHRLGNVQRIAENNGRVPLQHVDGSGRC